MIRGTTPTHVFKLHLDTSQIKTIVICYAQNDEVKLLKWTEDCTLEGENASVQLSQEETLSFKGDASIKAQVRVLLKNGEAHAFRPVWIWCDDVLYGEVLV